MKLITLCYIVNATILLLHEMESAYEKEWEILKLPGRITGFLIIHIPILIFLFFGVLEIEKESAVGMVIGIILGVCGFIPFIVHRLIVRTPGQFNLPISSLIIYLNILSGALLLVMSFRGLMS